MSRKNRDLPLIEQLEITELAAEGNSIGHHDGVVVFVPMTVPGDVVDVQIKKKHRRYMEGFVVAFRKKSELRVDAQCPHFGICGGCKWQCLPYEEQLRFKTRQVEDQLSRIGKLELPEVKPCLGSKETLYYRNKLEFTFADRRWLTSEEIASGADIEAGPALGFHIPNKFDKIFDIEHCSLQRDPSNAIRNHIKKYCIDHAYTFYNVREHVGLMRGVIIRTASTGDTMVIVIFSENDQAMIRPLLADIHESFPEVNSIMYFINEKWNDSLTDQTPLLFFGKDHITEEMEGLKFKVGPKSFYQTNSRQAYELYKTARSAAAIEPDDIVYDLYTGTGTIANFVARSCRKVVGIEYVEEAIEDAKVNSRENGIDNTSFFAGDMKKVLDREFIRRNGQPDVIILDPPRAGVDEEVIKVILEAAPKRMVYVSCNPATQARDLALMSSMYTIDAVQPVDMFPHTHHVENVVKLTKK